MKVWLEVVRSVKINGRYKSIFLDKNSFDTIISKVKEYKVINHIIFYQDFFLNPYWPYFLDIALQNFDKVTLRTFGLNLDVLYFDQDAFRKQENFYIDIIAQEDLPLDYINKVRLLRSFGLLSEVIIPLPCDRDWFDMLIQRLISLKIPFIGEIWDKMSKKDFDYFFTIFLTLWQSGIPAYIDHYSYYLWTSKGTFPQDKIVSYKVNKAVDPWLIDQVFIDLMGNIRPCPIGKPIGHIMKDDLIDVWNKYKESFKEENGFKLVDVYLYEKGEGEVLNAPLSKQKILEILTEKCPSEVKKGI